MTEELAAERRAADDELLRDVLRANPAFTADEIGRMGRDQLLDEVRKEAERRSLGVEGSREDPNSIAGRIRDGMNAELREQLVDLIDGLGGGQWPRGAIEQMGDRDLARIATQLVGKLDTSTGPGTTSGGGATRGSGGGTPGTPDGDPFSGRPIIGVTPGFGVPAGSPGGSDPGGAAPSAGTDAGGGTPGGSGSAGEGSPVPPASDGDDGDATGWTYLGDEWTMKVDGQQVRVQLWHDSDGNYVAVLPTGETRPVSAIVDSYGDPFADGGSTTVSGGSAGSSSSSGSSSGDSSEDDHDHDDESDGSDGDDTTSGDAGGSPGGDEDDDVEYTPGPDGQGGGAAGVFTRMTLEQVRSTLAAKLVGWNPGNVDPAGDGDDVVDDPLVAGVVAEVDRSHVVPDVADPPRGDWGSRSAARDACPQSSPGPMAATSTRPRSARTGSARWGPRTIRSQAWIPG